MICNPEGSMLQWKYKQRPVGATDSARIRGRWRSRESFMEEEAFGLTLKVDEDK